MEILKQRLNTAPAQSTYLGRYISFINQSKGLDFAPGEYGSLHQWSIENSAEFWPSLIEFFEPKTSGPTETGAKSTNFIPYSWFPGLKLNYAENLLRALNDPEYLNRPALSFYHESGYREVWTYEKLGCEVAKVQAYLAPLIREGDVVAAYMPNSPHTVAAMLAASGLGAIFTSTSADFGTAGVLDRFGQTRPKVLLAASYYTYNGKLISQKEKIEAITHGLPSLKGLLLVDVLPENQHPHKAPLQQDQQNLSFTPLFWSDLPNGEVNDLVFTPLPFKAPLYIMYSSGTTGRPKCIVHSQGGVLLQHIKEIGLHTDVRPGEKIFFFTTCGWMMWNWLVSALFFKAEVVLYEGSPAHPDLGQFLRLISEEEFTYWGLSPKFLKALELSDIPIPPLPKLKTILSTGAPLLPEQFDYVYQTIKSDVHLASISGGTDIIGCFMLGNPLLPVYRGEIQCLGLGMDVQAIDSAGQPVREIEGELVCRQSFPSCPLGFWGDKDNTRFKAAYFERYPGLWHHGDFIRISEAGTVRVYGRSDATLNPGGVRIGTAEIYRQTETLPFIEDALCVGLPTADGSDVSVGLFLKLKGKANLDGEKIRKVKEKIRLNTTPRHVPKRVFSVGDIPYTRSGKKMELLISRLFSGREPDNIEAMANPQCLEDYRAIKNKL